MFTFVIVVTIFLDATIRPAPSPPFGSGGGQNKTEEAQDFPQVELWTEVLRGMRKYGASSPCCGARTAHDDPAYENMP